MFPSFDLYSKDTHRRTMLYGGSIIINSIGLYGKLVLSIAVVLRLLFNCICSSCLLSQILHEVSKITSTYRGRREEDMEGRENKRKVREKKKRETGNHIICQCCDEMAIFFFSS